MPLSERQQLALLMQMTAEKTQQAGTWTVGTSVTCVDYLYSTRRKTPHVKWPKNSLLKQLIMFCHVQPILRCVNTFVLEILVAKM